MIMVYVDDKDNEAFDKKMSGGHDNVSSSADSEDDCDVEEPSQHITTLINNRGRKCHRRVICR